MAGDDTRQGVVEAVPLFHVSILRDNDVRLLASHGSGSSSQVRLHGGNELLLGVGTDEALPDLPVSIHHHGQGETEELEMRPCPLVRPHEQAVIQAVLCRKGPDIGRSPRIDGNAHHLHPRACHR
jgi:hypothetical protein